MVSESPRSDEILEAVPSAFVQNLLLRKKEILTGSAAVLAGIAILIGYFQSGPNAAAYAHAERAIAKWEASPQDDVLYREMQEAVRKAPAIEKKYEAAIAQKLIEVEKFDQALEMANRSLLRVKDAAPLHTAYAAASLLIERGAYQEALERAVALKEEIGRMFDVNRLSEDWLVGGSLLYAHNLVRIACLHQELKNHPGEKAAWEEFERFLQEGTPLADLVIKSFSEKQLDLTQYIAERKKQL